VRLSQQRYSRGDTDESYEVLVDEHPVGPGAAYASLPGGEAEGGYKERRVGHGPPRSNAHFSPASAQEIREGERQDSETSESMV